MSELKTLAPISEAELATRGVAALGNRPNVRQQYGVGGLSPEELKRWFDNLGRGAADKINALLAMLAAEDAVDYIKAPPSETQELNTLGDMIRAFYSGVFAESVMRASLPGFFEDDDAVYSVQDILNEIAESIGLNNEAIHTLKTTKKITKAPGADMNESCYVTLDADITIGGVTFPKWAKGTYIVADQDATLTVTSLDGTLYTAYKNVAQDTWTASVAAKKTQLAYELAKTKGYAGTEADFATLIATLKAVEANPGADATATLSKIGVGGTVYSVPQGGGTNVEANPPTIGDTALWYLTVGKETYKIPSEYDYMKSEGYTGTEAEFRAKLAELLALEIWDGESEDIESEDTEDVIFEIVQNGSSTQFSFTSGDTWQEFIDKNTHGNFGTEWSDDENVTYVLYNGAHICTDESYLDPVTADEQIEADCTYHVNTTEVA